MKLKTNKNQEINSLHILDAIINIEESILHSILRKLDVNISNLQEDLLSEISKLPKAIGGQTYLSQDGLKVLNQAEKEAKKLRAKRIELARRNTWEVRVGQISKFFT